jgi:hypothetical protein
MDCILLKWTVAHLVSEDLSDGASWSGQQSNSSVGSRGSNITSGSGFHEAA